MIDLAGVTVVALGSNLPGGEDLPSSAVIEAALADFEGLGLKLLARSRLWRSAAWPCSGRPEYFNAVALVETELSAEAVLAGLHGLEAVFGRRRTGSPNADRTLDLDLIAQGRIVQAGPPALPHPRAAERLFVMGPLAEIAPEWRHPVSGSTATALAGSALVGRDARPI